jgi:hypothetical protein
MDRRTAHRRRLAARRNAARLPEREEQSRDERRR